MPKPIKPRPRGPASGVGPGAAAGGPPAPRPPSTPSGPDEAAPASTESLQRAGFPIDAEGQARFLSRVQARLYARLEAITGPAWLPLSAAVLAGGGAWLRSGVGDAGGAAVAAAAAVLHLALLGWTTLKTRGRRRAEGPPDSQAAFVDEAGTLQVRLEPGERVLRAAGVDGKNGRFTRWLGGAFQAAWGVLLAGLPLAAAGGAPLASTTFALLVLGTFLGTALFGRGVRAILGTDDVKRLVLTDRRVVVIAGPGAAISVPLDELRHRPLVLARQDGTATLALDVRPRVTFRPVPAMGLLGLDRADPDEARRWAAAAMDARRRLVDERRLPDRAGDSTGLPT